jgi:hypothetical protein
MASSSPARKGTRSKPIKDRRSGAPGATTPLRKLKGLLVRPIGLERHDGKLKVVLAERRRPRPANEQPSLALLCAELSARMLTHEADETARTMRHLILVHDALERRGWAGVETMSSLVLREALRQAETLAAEDASPHLDMLIEGLRPLHAAAALRDQRESRQHEFKASDVEVSESDYTEFEDVEQNWAGTTMPADLVPPPERDDS